MKTLKISDDQSIRLYIAVKKMRLHQTIYFKYRDYKALNNSKKYEALTDGILSQIDFCNDENKESLLFKSTDFEYPTGDEG